MRKLIATIALIVACAPLARGQCSPNPCYTDNQPQVSQLTASQAAAQGSTAVTLSVTSNGTDPNGIAGQASHNLTQTIATGYTLNWSTLNPPSGATAKFSILQTGASWGANLNGSWPIASTTNYGLETFVFTLYDSMGNAVTQDLINVTGISGSIPGIVSEDGNPDNIYVRINTSGSGGSMAADFTECQGGQIHQCINATHTPYTTLTLNNTTQGTSQVNPKHQSGNIANYTSSVSFGDSIIVAAGLNDILDFSEEDEVDCSVSGPIPLPNYHLRIIPYQIFDKVDSYDGKVRFQVEPWCYNCCIPAKQGCPEPITLTDHVTYSPGGNPPKIPTFFYSLGFCANGNFPGMVSGQWECSPGLAIPFYGTGWIKAYCTPYENPPY